MRRILVIAPFPPSQAAEAKHAFDLCERLANRGLDVQVVTSRGSVDSGRPGLTVHPVISRWSWPAFLRLASVVRRCSPDVVLLVYLGSLYGEHPMITFAPFLSRLVRPRARFVTLFEDVYGAMPLRGSLLTRIVRKAVVFLAGAENLDYSHGSLLRDSDCIIAVSERVRKGLTERFAGAAKKSVVIPPPSLVAISPADDEARARHRHEVIGAKPGDCLLVFFGYVYPGKGLETLLAALRLVTAQRANIRLMMVGGTLTFPARPFYAQEMRELAQRLGCADRILWIGGYAWDSDEPSRYLHAADLCILPFDVGASLHNSSLAAAAAHGLPIITTQSDTTEEAFVHGENVFLCQPGSPQAIAAAIETLMDAPDLRRRLASGALTLAHEWFSGERAVDRLLAAIETSSSS